MLNRQWRKSSCWIINSPLACIFPDEVGDWLACVVSSFSVWQIQVEASHKIEVIFTHLSNLLQAVQCRIATTKGIFTAGEVSDFTNHTKDCLVTATVVSSRLHLALKLWSVSYISSHPLQIIEDTGEACLSAQECNVSVYLSDIQSHIVRQDQHLKPRSAPVDFECRSWTIKPPSSDLSRFLMAHRHS